VNYFELHIGDYAEATSHLTFVEDAAYSRLIRKYYATERPIPADLKSAQRLVGARTREDKEAVKTVLEEFFTLEDDGWHQARCDAQIAQYQAGEPERALKKANEEARLKKHREERSNLFEALQTVGIHTPWNTPISKLRELVKRHCNGEPATPATAPATEAATQPATAPATPATATQSPNTTSHTPNKGEKKEQRARAARPPPKTPLPDGFGISERVRAWADERGHDRLPEHFEAFVSKAKAKGYVYADWDEALMGAIRDDWAELRSAKAGPSRRETTEEHNRREAEAWLRQSINDARTIDA
jgi:uncharacterized protein YdaU (DUF1376 family)